MSSIKSWRDVIPVHPAADQTSWRDVLAAATPAMQNASKRAAIKRMLLAHPNWSNRRIAASVHLILITDDDLDLKVGGV